MQLESTRILFSYWNNLRGARSAPERRNVDPTKIRSALSNTFILEADQGRDFSFRLAGSHLCSAYCRELKGRAFMGLWQLRDRDAVSTLIKAVTEDHAAALITFEGTSSSNKKVSFETVLLPLRHNGASNNRILGGLSAKDEPYWFGTQPILEQRITGLRLIWPDDLVGEDGFGENPHHMQRDVVFGESSAAASVPVKVHGVDGRRYAHLSVIDGGRN
ncbi:MAG TPA: PAS domain-containing protein [Devosia sp.]|nr:PAS domain-containing protein [Devosia sp.]